MKKISVVVPVYKVEDYLARAVRSLQQQTHENQDPFHKTVRLCVSQFHSAPGTRVAK